MTIIQWVVMGISIVSIVIFLGKAAAFLALGAKVAMNDKKLYKYLLTADYELYRSDRFIWLYIIGTRKMIQCENLIVPFLYQFYIDDIGAIPVWYSSHKYLKKILRAKCSSLEVRDEKYIKVFGQKLP